MILKWRQVSWVIKYAEPDKENLSLRYIVTFNNNYYFFMYIFFYALVNMFSCKSIKVKFNLKFVKEPCLRRITTFVWISKHLLTPEMTLAQDVERSVTNTSPPQDSSHLDDQILSRKQKKSGCNGFIILTFESSFLVHAYSKWDVGRKYC